MKRQKHAKLLDTIEHHIQQSKGTIHLHKVKAYAGILGNKCAGAVAQCTLQPMFILRHLQHAARTIKPNGSPRLHAAFIDFKQAYDTIPRDALWKHLRRTRMPAPLLSVIQDMYNRDEYVLKDGDKTARVHLTRGVKQGCPLSPLLFSLYIYDIDDIAEGVSGAITGTAGVHVSHMLYADDLTLLTNEPRDMQIMLSRLAVYARKQ